MSEQTTFDTWAIVEIMGHVTLAGRVTEQALGGASFVRVDVPECNGQPAFTRLYGASAIYSITPVDEETGRLAVEQLRPRPVTVYGLPRQLPAPGNERRIVADVYTDRDDPRDYHPDDDEYPDVDDEDDEGEDEDEGLSF